MDISPTANYAAVNAGTFYPQAPSISNKVETDVRKADPASGYPAYQYPTHSFFRFRSVGSEHEVMYRDER